MKKTGVLLFLLAASGVPALCEADFVGEWGPLFHEDYPERFPGPELGDYMGIPINNAARLRGDAYDADRISVVPEYECRPHGGDYSMRGLSNLRISEEYDKYNRLLAIHTRMNFDEQARTIWMDGRPHPSEYAEHTWDGFSTGKVEGNQLTITTTHMKYGVIQRNGVPSSPHAVMTETFIRHGDYLTLVSIVDDPVYLEEPFIRTSQWARTSNLAVDERFILDIADEVTRPQGYVPHYPLGIQQSEFALKYGLPFEATQGGKETTYPEYELKLRRMIEDSAKLR